MTAAVSERYASLTPRELQCLRLVADLRDTQQIAFELGLSPNTVDSYIRDAVAKLGAANRRQAAALVRDWAADTPPEKIGSEIPRVEGVAGAAPTLASQFDGDAAGSQATGQAVREMPTAYHGLSGGSEARHWSPLPGLNRDPSGLPPLRRLGLIVGLVFVLGMGIGLAVLTVAGAIVAVEKTSRP